MVELRPHQKRASDWIVESVASGSRILALQMATGRGKTLAVLHAFWRLSLEHGVERMFVFTRTRNEYEPYVRDVRKFELPFRVAYLYAKEDLCANPSAKGALSEGGEFANPCRACPLFGSALPPDEVLDAISSGWDFVEYAKDLRKCPYYSLKAAIPRAEVVALTYPYGFTWRSNVIAGLYDDPFALRSSFAVVDEAHNVEKSVPDLYSTTLTADDASRAHAVLVESGLDDDARELKPLISWLKKAASSEEKHIPKDKLPRPQINELAIEDVIGLLSIQIFGARGREREEIRRDISALSRVLRLYRYVDVPNSELFTHPRGVRLRMMLPTVPVRRFYEAFGAVLFMSGTMPPTDHLEKVWGVKCRFFDADRGAGTWGRKRAILFADLTSRYEERDEMIPRMARAIAKILDVTRNDGVRLVVYPSYDFMRKVLSQEPGLRDGAFVEEERAARSKITDIAAMAVRGDVTVVHAVAGGKLTEGVEIVDGNGRSLIRHVVLAGVPYPEVSEYMRIKSEMIRKITGRDPFRYAYHVPASLAARQAIGRAVRREDDEATVWLLDSRFTRFRGELGIEAWQRITTRELDRMTEAGRGCHFGGRLL